MPVLAQTFLTFVSGHLVSFMLLSVWHNIEVLNIVSYLTFSEKAFEALNEGIL